MDQLLQELTELYAPSALEDELRRFVTAKLERLCDEVTTDACGNVIGLVRPSNPSPLPAITILTHMDEISMVCLLYTSEVSCSVMRTSPAG